jgi:hypothetical protein
MIISMAPYILRYKKNIYFFVSKNTTYGGNVRIQVEIIRYICICLNKNINIL